MRALYPGSFDPVTEGHREILRRSARLFDEVVACVMVNPAKTGRFPIDERRAMLVQAASGLANVTVDFHTGLLVDYCARSGIDVVVRAVRNTRDVDYEFPMVQANHGLAGVETILLAADPSRAHISSTLVTAMAARALSRRAETADGSH